MAALDRNTNTSNNKKRKLFLLTCKNYKISVSINKVLLEYSHEDHMTYTEGKTRHLDLETKP